MRALPMFVTSLFVTLCSMHFGDDKTKSTLYASKHKGKCLGSLNIVYNIVSMKPFMLCVTDETMGSN